MDWAPGLRRQSSCQPAVLGVGNWCSGGLRGSLCRRPDNGYAFDYDDDDEEFDESDYTNRRSNVPIWRVLWRRVVKEKNRLFSSTSRLTVGYDPYTYAQNFDRGSAGLEPENLTRSFSARYADSSKSRIFQRVG